MALKAILTEDEQNALPEALKGEYKKNADGNFVLDVIPTSGYALEDVVGLKGALGKERNAREALEQAQKAFEGLDPEAARKALAKLEEIKDNPLDEKVKAQVDAREKALNEKFAKELGAKDTEIGDYRSQLEEHLVTASATAAIAKHKGVVDLLLPHVKSQVRVEKDAAGKFTARVIGADGHPRISLRQGNSENMTIEELVETMRESDTFGVAFEGSQSSGTGAENNAGGTGGKKTVSFGDSKAMSANIEDIASGKIEVTD